MENRRKEDRFRVRPGAYAIDSNFPQRFGEILDISRSGVAFSYLDGPNNFNPATKLGLFSSVHSLFLENIPFETIADIQLLGHPASSVVMRRYSGRFPSLSIEQQEQLDRFIDLHALKPE